MNSIGKRIGGVLILILAALVLLASVGGVVGLWAVNGEAHDLADAVFAPVENGLTTANKALDKVNTRVTNARTRVNSAQDFVSQLGTNLPGNGVVLAAISNTIGAKLGDEIDGAQESAGNARDLANGVNNTLVAVNKLPGVSVPTLTNRLQSIQDGITSAQTRVQQLRSDLQAMAQGKLQATGDRINSALSDVDGRLQNIQTTIANYTGSVQQTQTRIAGVKSDLHGYITIGWIAATLFLIWIAISQVAMLLYGWSLVKSKPTVVVAPVVPPAAAPTVA